MPRGGGAPGGGAEEPRRAERSESSLRGESLRGDLSPEGPGGAGAAAEGPVGGSGIAGGSDGPADSPAAAPPPASLIAPICTWLGFALGLGLARVRDS